MIWQPARVRYGYRRLTVLLRREGWQVNHKLVYRLYVEEGLLMRRRNPKRRKSCAVRLERPTAQGANECWSMDFMADQLFQGQRFRILTLVDNFSRESLALRAAQRFRGDDVVKVLEAVTAERGLPQDDPRGQRTGVHLEVFGLVGLLQRREARLQPAGKAHG